MTDTIQPDTDYRRATDREIRLAREWATQVTADWNEDDDIDAAREAEYESALEIIIHANGGRQSQPRPPVVVLCGSTRFYDAFQQANYDLTMAGNIVLSVGFYPHAKAEHGHGEGVGHDSSEKVALDELHKRKIDMADEVLVVSDDSGYFGDSTTGEIRYALAIGRPIRFAHAAAEERWNALA